MLSIQAISIINNITKLLIKKLLVAINVLVIKGNSSQAVTNNGVSLGIT